MRFLLDTHTFLWWITDNPQMSSIAYEIISNRNNVLFLSAVSVWEMAIKAKLGRLHLPDNFENFILTQISLNAIQNLPIQTTHALHIYNLPNYHRDPFDRMLVAQAQIENLTILTADPLITQYQVEVIW